MSQPTSKATVLNSEVELPAPVRPAIPFSAGDVVGDYKITAIVGQGSFATVYLAEEISLNRRVALKVCAKQMWEGRTIAQLNHDSILRVNSQSLIQGYAVINMQYVPSITLEDLTKEIQKPRPAEAKSLWLTALGERLASEPALTDAEFETRRFLEAHPDLSSLAYIGAHLADAVAHAHDHGVLHLDIKPSNILMHVSGKPYLMDFNTATQREELKTGVPENFGGTFDYMSPEQLAVFFSADQVHAVGEVDEHSDIYALGKVLLETLKAFSRDSEEKKTLEFILLTAVQPAKQDRFSSAHEMAAALRGYLEISKARSRMPRQSFVLQWSERNPLLSISILGGLPQLIAAIVGYLYNQSQIVNQLSHEQQATFVRLNLYYNPILYVIGMGVWLSVVGKMHRASREFAETRKNAKACRRLALSLPAWSAAVTSLGWLPGMVLFPAVLAMLPGGLSPTAITHLVVSFLLSYLIALAYSYIIQAYLVTHILYPRFWAGDTKVREMAAQELSPVLRRVRQSSALTLMIPVLSLSYLLMSSTGFEDKTSYQNFRLLIELLSSPGAAGVWFAVLFKEKIRFVTKLFTGSLDE